MASGLSLWKKYATSASFDIPYKDDTASKEATSAPFGWLNYHSEVLSSEREEGHQLERKRSLGRGAVDGSGHHGDGQHAKRQRLA